LYRNQESIDRTRKNFELHGKDTVALFHKIDWTKGDVIDIMSLKTPWRVCLMYTIVPL
jgi:hypothetical protein